jgi:hypothetical protein
MNSSPAPPPPPGPSPEEIAAAERAKAARISSTQQDLQQRTDMLFRLFSARTSFGL